MDDALRLWRTSRQPDLRWPLGTDQTKKDRVWWTRVIRERMLRRWRQVFTERKAKTVSATQELQTDKLLFKSVVTKAMK